MIKKPHGRLVLCGFFCVEVHFCFSRYGNEFSSYNELKQFERGVAIDSLKNNYYREASWSIRRLCRTV
jgi:hypothetical protein